MAKVNENSLNERAHRAEKMLALIAAIEAFADREGRRFTAADVRDFSSKSWELFTSAAGCFKPSQETIDAVVEHYALRERILNPFKGYPRAVSS